MHGAVPPLPCTFSPRSVQTDVWRDDYSVSCTKICGEKTNFFIIGVPGSLNYV